LNTGTFDQKKKKKRAPNVEMPVPVCVCGMLSKERLLDLVAVEESFGASFDRGTY
jgi:hypothetical protein